MPINSRHPQYSDKLPTWIEQRDTYDGEKAIKSKGQTYLPKPSGFQGSYSSFVATAPYNLERDTSEYGAYIKRAKFYDAPFRTTTALTGAATAKPATLQGIERIENDLNDITLSGISLEGLIREVIHDLILIGRYGIMLMWAEDRPKWVGYNAERIINWQVEAISGREVPIWVMLEEHVVESGPDKYAIKAKCIYRELYLDDNGYLHSATYEKSESKVQGADEYVITSDIMPQRNGMFLDFIPFVVLNTTQLGFDIEKGILEGLSSLALSYYRHSADYEHGLHMTALPTGVITGYTSDSDLYVGSTTFIQIPEPEARVYFLEYQGHGLQSHERSMETDKAEMAIIGARLLEAAPESPETLGAYKMRHINDSGSLRGIADVVSQACTWLLRRHAWWSRATDDVDDPDITAALNKDFVSIRMSPQDLQALLQALNDGRISYNTFFYNLKQGEIIPPDVDLEQEKELIEIEAPTRLPLLTGFAQAASTNGIVMEAEV